MQYFDDDCHDSDDDYSNDDGNCVTIANKD